MRNWGIWRYGIGLTAVVGLVFVGAPLSYAISSNSTNYRGENFTVGGAQRSQSCSGVYCAETSIGDMTAGSASSATMQSQQGSNPEAQPLLEVEIEAGSSDLGVFSTEQTMTKTSTVRVRNYLSEGYQVQLTGTPPSYGGHTLKAMDTAATSMPGREQFGINLVANTTPVIGANPQQLPSGATSFGAPTAGYDTPDLFMFKNGDVVARSNSSSGETVYTISMIVNVSTATPAGLYTSDLSVVIVPIY